jgi:hypothetical protein
MYNFPDTPTMGQQVITPAGVVFTWDGAKWYSNYPPPSLDVDFTTSIPAGFTFSRSTGASYLDPVSGNVVDYASGAPRFIAGKGLLLEPSALNLNNNPRHAGAAVGTPPIGFSQLAQGGLNTQVVGVGVENGMEYIDLRLFATSTTNAYTVVTFGSVNITDNPTGGAAGKAANTETLMHDTWYIKLVAAPNWGILQAGNPTNLRYGHYEYDSSQTGINATTSFTTWPNSTSPLSSQVFQRRGGMNAAAVYARPALFFANMGVGQSYDITLRIGHVQLGVGVAAYGSPIRTATVTAVTGGITRAADGLVGTLGSWFDPRYISCAVAFTDARSLSFGGRSAPLISFDDGTGNATNYNIPPLNYFQLLENSGGGWYAAPIVNEVTDNQWPNDGGGIYQLGQAGAICVSGAPNILGGRSCSNLLAQGTINPYTPIFDPSKYTRIVFNEGPNMYSWYSSPVGIPGNMQRFLRKFRYYPRMLSPTECHDIAMAMA